MIVVVLTDLLRFSFQGKSKQKMKWQLKETELKGSHIQRSNKRTHTEKKKHMEERKPHFIEHLLQSAQFWTHM